MQQKEALNKLGAVLRNTFSDPVIDKLLQPKECFAARGVMLTNELIRAELKKGARLMATTVMSHDTFDDMYSEIHETEFEEKFISVALKENADVVKFIGTIDNSPADHIARGLAYGIDPVEIVRYFQRAYCNYFLRTILRQLGIKLASDYDNQGYSSAFHTEEYNEFSICVEPDDRFDIGIIDQLGNLEKVLHFCPECGDYVEQCHHKPVHDLTKPANERHWFMYIVKISPEIRKRIMDEAPIRCGEG